MTFQHHIDALQHLIVYKLLKLHNHVLKPSIKSIVFIVKKQNSEPNI